MATACTVNKLGLFPLPHGSGTEDATCALLASVAFSTALSTGMTCNLSSWLSYCYGGVEADCVSTKYHVRVLAKSTNLASGARIQFLATDGSRLQGSDVSAYSGKFLFFGR